MVKTGILGADSPIAGEIIRILINHPEVIISQLYAPNSVGNNVSAIHHGLIGEAQLIFTDKINLEELDLIIILEHPKYNDIINKIFTQTSSYEDLKIILLNHDHQFNDYPIGLEIGLSEYNRKALVRGSKYAFIPSPIVVPILIALAPLADFMLLNSDIEIRLSLPENILSSFSLLQEKEIIKYYLTQRQASFQGEINFNSFPSSSNRALAITIDLKTTLPIDEIEKIYEQIYDDHNFSFLTKKNLDTKEVEGTQKVLFNINKIQSDTLRIDIVSDAILRGGAGDIVHILNLLFGLHEKTGLHLKVSRF